jgi:glycerol-3-phosphate acyltransferase PlsY
MAMTVIVTIIGAYLIGSINFAVIFAKAFMQKDVRELGSGNAGTTNVMRNAGFLPGLLTFVFDALKGFVACFMGKYIFEYVNTKTGADITDAAIGALICGLACMLGHVFPIFFDFKGGKGIATSVGIFAVCSPIAIIVGLAVFAVVVLVTKYVSLGSVISAIAVVVLAIIFCDKTAMLLPQIIITLAMGVIVITKHSENIKRLMAGTESKVKLGKK